MSGVRRLWVLLTALHRYPKSFSTRGQGDDTLIDAPILAYLLETANGRLLVDVGCDYHKVADAAARARWFEQPGNVLGAPKMTDEQRISTYLARLGLDAADVDAVILTHLHFDHAGGLGEVAHADVHLHALELAAAEEHADPYYFAGEISPRPNWRAHPESFSPVPGVTAIETPGHTRGHLSVFVELEQGRPILLAGDAADLTENLEHEIAPGLCYRDDPEPALASIRELKALAAREGAELWPNHDIEFFRRAKRFPESYG